MESKRNKQNSASSMSRQFPSHRVPLFDNEMIALAGKNGANISKQMKREELIKWARVQFEVHWGQRSTDTFLGFIQHSFLRYTS
jgi:hypothetical protein